MAQEAEASRLINLVAALEANSQAYPVDVILPSRLLGPSWVLGRAEERPLPKPQAAVFLFCVARSNRTGAKKNALTLPCGRRRTDCPRVTGIHWSWVSDDIRPRGGGSGHRCLGHPPGIPTLGSG